MIVESIIITSCIYSFAKEQWGNQQKKIQNLSQKLTIPPPQEIVKNPSLKEKIQEVLAPFREDKSARNQQLQEFSEVTKSEEEKEIDKNIAIAGTSMGLAIGGALLFPPLKIFAIGGLIWSSVPIFKSGLGSLKKEKIDADVIDALAIASTLAMGYLVIGAFADLFYHAGKKLLLKTEDRSIKKLVNLYGEQPKSVWLVKGELEIEIPFDKLEEGHVISIKAGEFIPIDGRVVEGHALVNQQALTGESQPVKKGAQDTCFAATLVLEGNLHIQVEKSGSETVAAQIVEMLHNSVDFKEVMISKGQEVADDTSPPILGLSILTLPLMGLTAATAVVNSSFGYILKMVSPMMVLNYLTISSQEGILIKDGRSLEFLSKVDTVVFDKTGTLTLPQPHVGKIHSLNGLSENVILTYAAAAEHRQSHPIAEAIIQEAKDRQLDLPPIEEAKYNLGYGLEVTIEQKQILLGSVRFIEMEGIHIPKKMNELYKEAHEKGNSFVHIAIDGLLEGVLELYPTLRSEAKEIVKQLQEDNKTCYIISGDHEMPTRYLAQQLGIEHYFAEVLPEDKAKLVEQLQKQQKTVCFIGDGINDSLALKKADVSVSLRGASTIATDTAQIILTSENLKQLPLLFVLGNQFSQHMTTNLATAVVPAVVVIGGIFFLKFGLVAAIIGNQISLTAGIGNALHPMVTYQQAKIQQQETMALEQKQNKREPSKSLSNQDIEVLEFSE